jgi:HK97 family phage major capsid protein
VAIEVGRDFLSDAGVNVGQVLTRLIGERLAAELDRVSAGGNGTTQPEGLVNASGIGSVTTENGAGGPPTLADYLTLMFSIGKQYRSPSNRCAFISNDVSYQRSRSIKIDVNSPSTDQRPVLGLEAVNSYVTLDWPHRIQNDLLNTRCAFGALNRYRMYRRTGLELCFERGGKELARKNLTLLVACARFGGPVTDGDAFAIWTSGQS